MRMIYLFLVFILLLQNVSAQYISGDVYILSNGDVSFFVDSDKELNIEGLIFENNGINGKTSSLTSKSGKEWFFILDFGDYEIILLEIHLPKNLKSINHLEGVDRIIDIDGRTISLIGENEKLYFQIEYELKNENDFFWVFFSIIFILSLLVLYLFFDFFKRKKKKLKDIFPLINDNEKMIIELLMKKPMRQRELRKKLEIPKASFSRYLVNLEKKKLIFREGEGKNKVIKLK